MDPKLRSALVRDCVEALGAIPNLPLDSSAKHLRALRKARGMSMVYRSRLVLQSMGYDHQFADLISKNLLKKTSSAV